jgi:N-methylhydantoinase B
MSTPSRVPRPTEPVADPITTEVIRHGLNSAANQMKRALMRTAFSPVIYEVLDFAVALYDRRVRLLAQAPSMPIFMGTLNFCVETAVEAVGGAEALEPGDILLYNFPYGTGSHAQDAALVMPVFHAEELAGYAVVKAHWLDVGGKEPYSTDTIDLHQEGTIFPGVKLYRRGELVPDIHRIVIANNRFPKMVAGDLEAEVVTVRTGSAALLRLLERYGTETFEACVERMFDHGEAVVRSYIEKLPDGRHVGRGAMDDNGVETDLIPFDVALEIDGSKAIVDFTECPDVQAGPVNCPLPSTVSASRVAISMLAGGGEAPNEGHFRPIEVRTRPHSMFHPEPPAPCFLYAWAAFQAIEAIYHAASQADPAIVPACSGGDICALIWWGVREATGEPWADAGPHPVGQGANVGGDGASALIHVGQGATRMTPVEVWEAKNPWLVEEAELAADSGGAGRQRGGLGCNYRFRVLEDCWVTPTIERTRTAPWGLAGGEEARPNRAVLTHPDGTELPLGKATAVKVPRGSTLAVLCAGGGGYGPPAERDPEAVRADVREGFVSEAAARDSYPHAFGGEHA